MKLGLSPDGVSIYLTVTKCPICRWQQLEHKSEEARHLESKVSGLEEKLKAAEENSESYVEKLKQLQELHQQQADQHRNEMAAQSRLSNIYKIASQENDGKVLELVSGDIFVWHRF